MVQASLSTSSSNPPKADSSFESETPLREWLNHLVERIIPGDRINRTEAIALTQIDGRENILLLCEAADQTFQTRPLRSTQSDRYFQTYPARTNPALRWRTRSGNGRTASFGTAIGHYLTTLGQPQEQDRAMLDSLGLTGGEAPIPGEKRSQ